MSPELLRERCIALLTLADDGHPGSVMSLVDFVSTLNINERIVISEGHAAMVVYPLLHEAGILTDTDMLNFRKVGGRLTMFPHKGIPGILCGCGSLGNGIGYAAGLAMADPSPITCIISEGELYEGATWEALMFIRHYKLNNLRVVINKNDAIIFGHPEDCLSIPWNCVDPFSFVEIIQTVKGYGVPAWHGKPSSHYWSRP